MSRIQRVLLAASLSAISLSTLTLAVPTLATGPSAVTANQYVVKNGDFLAGIAAKLGVTLPVLLSANNLTAKSLIMPGDKLVLPAGASLLAATAPVGPAAGSLAYTVKPGDFLLGIAALYKVTLADLLTVNKLTVQSLILPGAKLAMPAGAVEPAAAPPVVQTNAGPAAIVVAYAYAQLGKPYRFFTAGPDTFDCSGLSMAAYAQIGIPLIHHSASQATAGRAVDIWGSDSIQPGDLVFMATHGDPSAISHVGIAVDATHWIHAPAPGDVVRLAPIPPKGLLAAVRRLVP
jgi:cell wall-associated NlpC family hydrolase